MRSAEGQAVMDFWLHACQASQIPGVQVTRLQRNERQDLYLRYWAERRRRGDKAREAWVCHATKNIREVIQFGLSTAFCSQDFNAYGVGIYSAADARLSNYFVEEQGGVRQMLICRMAAGRIAEKHRILPEGASKECWRAELRKPEHRKAPDGFDSCTSRHHTELVAYESAQMYAAYVVTYRTAGFAGDPYKEPLFSQLQRLDINNPASHCVQWPAAAAEERPSTSRATRASSRPQTPTRAPAQAANAPLMKRSSSSSRVRAGPSIDVMSFLNPIVVTNGYMSDFCVGGYF